MYGVIIERGLQNWQILQQENGCARVYLADKIEVEEEISALVDTRVIVRLMNENFRKIRRWKNCDGGVHRFSSDPVQVED